MAATLIAPPEFSVRVDTTPGVTIVAVHGELDIVTAPELLQVLRAAADRRDAVVVDLCNVAFCDSSGLTTLLIARDELAAAGGMLVIACAPGGPARRVFTVAGAEQALGFHETREAALRALA